MTATRWEIWRITEKGKGEVFFNPKEKYIWDLMFSESGSLLAAVGETGGIYEITGQSQGLLVLKADENHIKTLAKKLTEKQEVMLIK